MAGWKGLWFGARELHRGVALVAVRDTCAQVCSEAVAGARKRTYLFRESPRTRHPKPFSRAMA
jgi:hypothetical protein